MDLKVTLLCIVALTCTLISCSPGNSKLTAEERFQKVDWEKVALEANGIVAPLTALDERLKVIADDSVLSLDFTANVNYVKFHETAQYLIIYYPDVYIPAEAQRLNLVVYLSKETNQICFTQYACSIGY